MPTSMERIGRHGPNYSLGYMSVNMLIRAQSLKTLQPPPHPSLGYKAHKPPFDHATSMVKLTLI